VDERWLSVDEVAEYLGVSKDTVYAWVTNKGMPVTRSGASGNSSAKTLTPGSRDGGAASSSEDDLKEKSGDE